MYVTDKDQRDQEQYSERLAHAINMAQDRVRGDTPLYPFMADVRDRLWKQPCR